MKFGVAANQANVTVPPSCGEPAAEPPDVLLQAAASARVRDVAKMAADRIMRMRDLFVALSYQAKIRLPRMPGLSVVMAEAVWPAGPKCGQWMAIRTRRGRTAT